MTFLHNSQVREKAAIRVKGDLSVPPYLKSMWATEVRQAVYFSKLASPQILV